MLFKEVKWSGSDQEGDKAEYEEIPQEELWEDGELSSTEVQQKIIHHTFQLGDWILVRRLDG
tara:strand:+ start:489 stop:674 length:186 start_codon:yes stop_codon:yes gene_type:complete